MFYRFSQNNSGGSFDEDMGYEIWIEANTPAEADTIAEGLGVYFDGAGDCPCCGNRWHTADDWDSEERPEYRPLKETWGIPIKVKFKDQEFRDLTEEDCK